MGAIDVGIELGGTKVIVGASENGRDLTHRERIPTTDPSSTFVEIRAALEGLAAHGPIAAVGIGSFGPLDLRHDSNRYGSVVRSPKRTWSGANIVKGVTEGLDVPWAIDTDVNGALRAEHAYGAASGESAAYLTVGTGIGGGIWVRGAPVMGANHPEIGHVRVRRLPGDDFEGVCPYHGDCLEGLASGPAIEQRFGRRGDMLKGPALREARDLAAFYVAGGVVALCSVVPVETVVIGGGVSHMDGFHASVSAALPAVSGGYPPVPFDGDGPVIVPPDLGDDAGVIGAILLAMSVGSISEAS
jgi:fructokinase